MRLAAIDIGTVTTRLLVADVEASEGAPAVTEVERSTDITHLGEGLVSNRSLSREAMGRVAEVMKRYTSRMRELGVVEYQSVATSAARDAANAQEFVTLLGWQGVKAQVVSGEREAMLSFSGATYGLAEESGTLVVDVGGGSTELILGDVVLEDGKPDATITRAESYDVGSRRLTDAFLLSDPPSPHELASARDFADAIVAPYFKDLPRPVRSMTSVAGTATTAASIMLGMPTPEYDPVQVQGYVLSRGDLLEVTQMLAELPLTEREQVVGLHPGRAPVIVAGLVVLLATLDAAGLDSTRVSDRDILYGILLDTFRRRS